MKAIVVDDEMLARKRITSLLNNVEEIEIIQECFNGKSAISKINHLKPDIIFLDINKKDLNGFQVLQRIEIYPRPVIILVTAHDRHALKAFDFEVFDFLLKPFSEDRFFKTIRKVIEISQNQVDRNFEKQLKELSKIENKLNVERNSCPQIPVRQGNKTLLLKTSKIRYIIASGYYAEIYTKGKKLIIRESLSNLLKILNSNDFYRVHRSAIVNLSFIQEIVHSNYSEIDVRMKDNKLISVSKSHKKDFLKKLGF